MALTVVKRPVGVILQTVANVAAVTNSAGTALFTLAGHGLVDGDTIYIKGVRSAYNGFWYVDQQTVNTFAIKEYATATAQAFIATGNVNYYKSNGAVIWNAVHLPIVYKLKSDKWPINTVDTARTVTSFSNSNGYTQVLLSGDIKASGSADALEQVKISGTAALDGVYKILLWNSDISFVIDLSYSATNAFGIGTVQYYYGNYHARIRIYAGMIGTHYWASYKPYELVGTIEQQPDASGVVTVNVNEFLKKKISIMENNLLLDTLPNNLDAFCYFYISVAEAYDDANQYGTNDLNVSEFVGSYTNDTACIAINASLPFKTVSSGLMSEYMEASTFALSAPQKFLTAFEEPTLFVGHYFDVSFITNPVRTLIRKVYDANDVLLHTFTESMTNMGLGVYRYQIEQSAFLESKITIEISGDTDPLVIHVDSTCSAQDFYVTWLNHLGGFDYWNFKAETAYGTDIIESKTQDKNIYTNWPKSFGETADSRTKQTKRKTNDNVTLNSQYVDTDTMDALGRIVESPLVQQMNSIYDKRTIILDTASFPRKVDNQKLLMATIQARYTDENPSQSL